MKAEMQSFKAPGESYEIEHPHAKVTERDVHAASLDSGVQQGVSIVLQETVDHTSGQGDGHFRKHAKDGRTILIPQPSDNPEEPLNWSYAKKHTILFIVALGAYVGDFGALAGIPMVLVQGEEWNISPVKANYPNNLASVMCGVSGLIWVPLLNSWGRMPVLFWSQFLGALFTLGCGLSPNFTTYYAMRALQAVTQSASQSLGIAFVEDMFFFHEYARKIGIWYTIFLCAPFSSPMIGNFIVGKTGEWRPMFWLTLGLAGALLVFILVFGEETYYNRSIPPEAQRSRKKSYRLLRVLGIWQLTNRSRYFTGVPSSYLRLLEVLMKPVLPLTMLFYGVCFMWIIGITTSSAILLSTPTVAGGYGLSAVSVGFCFFTPLVGVFIGEAFGHFFNDFLAKSYMNRHSGAFKPEVRMWTTYVGGVVMIPGLIIFGQALQKHLNISAIIFSWGMYTVGVTVVSVATMAYVLDCYPAASGEVAALMNFGRVACGFTVAYFEMQWGLSQGFDVSFGIQAAIVAAAYVLAVSIQVFGPRLRARAGPVSPRAGVQ